eukprot:TRINITY_DN13602_c0_g1_i1.p1 TRINITY_DN13602_c0_g1~~TRINITY_DN13602_c0_g1_i1.p1  ORF type:complete len:193 (-),score=42.48 TRINITY_DN13602_c0_g1_i1:56-634(-)
MSETEKQQPSEENGGISDAYTWEQNDDEVTVSVPVPPGTTAKQLDIVIKQTTLKVGIKGQPPIIDGKLHKAVNTEDSMWSLEKDKNMAILYLQKLNLKHEEWWAAVIEGGPEIDLKKIKPPPKNYQDLDDGAQGVIRKMMFDQHQKRMGLPTSEEMMHQEAFKKLKEQFPDCGIDPNNINVLNANQGGMPPG